LIGLSQCIDDDLIKEYWSILLIPLLDRRNIGGEEKQVIGIKAQHGQTNQKSNL
jgi:hypothetical protein